MKDCCVWLYRGAWKEWNIDEIEMAIPLSPDQVLAKRHGNLNINHKKTGLYFKGLIQESFAKEQRIEIVKHLFLTTN